MFVHIHPGPVKKKYKYLSTHTHTHTHTNTCPVICTKKDERELGNHFPYLKLVKKNDRKEKKEKENAHIYENVTWNLIGGLQRPLLLFACDGEREGEGEGEGEGGRKMGGRGGGRERESMYICTYVHRKIKMMYIHVYPKIKMCRKFQKSVTTLRGLGFRVWVVPKDRKVPEVPKVCEGTLTS
jgi:hypothetical protein